jgi:hypothetical protein
VPGSLPICAGAIARRIQLDVLPDELHQIAGAIESDRHAGAAISSEARRFAEGVKTATGASGRLAPRDAERLFRLCRVGEERIADEAGSDLFTTTAAQAMAVGVAAGAGTKGGLGPLRGVLRSVRNLFLALYVLARSAVRDRAGFALATILLAIGGAIIAVGSVRTTLAWPRRSTIWRRHPLADARLSYRDRSTPGMGSIRSGDVKYLADREAVRPPPNRLPSEDAGWPLAPPLVGTPADDNPGA